MVEQRGGDLAVVRLPCGQAEPDRETVRIDDDMNLGREPAAWSTETVIRTPFCRCGLLVGANGSAVDHLNVAVMGGSNSVHQAVIVSISRSHMPAFLHRAKRL